MRFCQSDKREALRVDSPADLLLSKDVLGDPDVINMQPWSQVSHGICEIEIGWDPLAPCPISCPSHNQRLNSDVGARRGLPNLPFPFSPLAVRTVE